MKPRQFNHRLQDARKKREAIETLTRHAFATAEAVPPAERVDLFRAIAALLPPAQAKEAETMAFYLQRLNENQPSLSGLLPPRKK